MDKVGNVKIWFGDHCLLQCCNSNHKQYVYCLIYFVALDFFPIDWCLEGRYEVPNANQYISLLGSVCVDVKMLDINEIYLKKKKNSKGVISISSLIFSI